MCDIEDVLSSLCHKLPATKTTAKPGLMFSSLGAEFLNIGKEKRKRKERKKREEKRRRVVSSFDKTANCTANCIPSHNCILYALIISCWTQTIDR